ASEIRLARSRPGVRSRQCSTHLSKVKLRERSINEPSRLLRALATLALLRRSIERLPQGSGTRAIATAPERPRLARCKSAGKPVICSCKFGHCEPLPPLLETKLLPTRC